MKKRLLSLALCLALCLGLLPVGVLATEGGGVYEPPGSSTGGGVYEETQTEIWCMRKPSSISRSYNGTTDGSTIPITLWFTTNGTNELVFQEGTDFTAVKTFDSADAGNHTVTVKITLIGEAANKYKLRAGEETFTINGTIYQAVPDLTISLSKTTCTTAERVLPLLSIDGVEEGAEMTYYYTPITSSSYDSTLAELNVAISEDTVISEPGTYYIFARSTETQNYYATSSEPVEITVVDASTTEAMVSGTTTSYYSTLEDAFNAAQAGDTITLLKDITENRNHIYVSDGPYTLDLNGHKAGFVGEPSNANVCLEVGDISDDNNTVPGNLAVIDSSENKTGYLYDLRLISGVMTVKNGTFHLVGDYNTSTGTIKFESGNVDSKFYKTSKDVTTEISGGAFKEIYNIAGAGCIVADLLTPGYAFEQESSIVNGYTGSSLYSVRVVPHEHDMTTGTCPCGFTCDHSSGMDDNGKCKKCGQLLGVARVTNDKGVTCYTDLAEAIANADGGTVTMLNNVTVTTSIAATSDFTLDLNGKTITGNSNVASIFLIYRNGNVIICDTNRTNVGLIKATSYATGNGLFNLQGGKLTIQDGTFQANKATIYAMSGELVINGGTFTGEVFIYHPVSTSISGGTFSQIHAAYSTISSLLANGYGFKRISNNAWLSSRDIIQEYSYSQVTVTEAPDLNIAITANQVYSYGDPIDLTANLSDLDSNKSVTYQWYFVDFNDNHHILDPIAEASENTYAPSNLLPNKYDSATSSYQQYTYYCTATCDGYTVGKKVNFRVTKADLSNATVTITNPEQLVFVPNPGSSNQSTGIAIDCKNHIKVTLPNGTEVPSNSYTVTGNVASSAGKHTLTIQGQDSCYTGSKSIEWTLLPFKLTKPALLSIIKDYDGTTDLPELALHEFYHNDPSAGSLITLNQGSDFTVEGKFDSAEVGYRTATLTFHLLNQNYTFADGSDTLVCGASTTSTSSISIRILEATPVGAPTLSKSALTYGETLSAITLSGSMKNKANNEPVEGTFTWQTPDEKPGVAEKHVAIWIFTPKDTTHYKTVAGEVTITVNKATPTGAPKYTAITTSGKKLSDASLTQTETSFSVPGTVAWKLPADTEVTANTAYEWVFTPNDTDNYNTLTGTITLWHKSSSGSSSGAVTPGTKTDTVKNPDGSTTKTETKADGSKTETTTASSGGGSTGTTVTKTDAKGNTTTEASAKLSDRDVKEAQEKGEAVTVPVKGIAAAKDANAATKIKIDVPNNANKTTVEIPVENVTSGTVAVIVHEDGTEELVKDSKPTEGGVQLELSGSTTVKIIDNSKTFDDTKDHWSRDEVNFVAARELFNGVGGNQFGVSQPMTRGMVNTVLARLAGVDTTPSQGQAWYEVGTDWAKKNGISDGTNPTAPVTREQLATLLYRYAGSPSVSGTLHAADAASVSDYAEDALLWANQNGIVNGVGSNTIAPKDNAQRAQVAAMLARYLKNQ